MPLIFYLKFFICNLQCYIRFFVAYKKYNILFVLLSLICTNLHAQFINTTSEANIAARIKIGPGFTTFNDDAISNQSFKGISTTGAVVMHLSKPKWQHELELSYSNGSLSNIANEIYKSSIKTWLFIYEIMYAIIPSNETKHWNANSGLVLQNRTDQRKYNFTVNNSESNEQSISIGAIFLVGYTINPGNSFLKITNQSSIGLMSFANQSSFGSSNANGTSNKERSNFNDLFKNGSFQTVSNHLLLNNEISLMKSIKNHHALLMNYTWQLNRMEINRKTIQHMHLIQLQYQYTF